MSKKTRAELISAIAMLLVAAIAMTSASFAWFTLSTAPEVAVEVQMGTTANLEIARASSGAWKTSGTAIGDEEVITEVTSNDAIRSADGKSLREFTWGSKVSTYEGGEGINFPVMASGGSFYYPEYSEDDGRTMGLNNVLAPSNILVSGRAVQGVQAYKANVYTVGKDTSANSVTSTKAVAVGYQAWLRSNQNVTVTMSAASEKVVFWEKVPAGTIIDSTACPEATYAAIKIADDGKVSYVSSKDSATNMKDDVKFTVRTHTTNGAVYDASGMLDTTKVNTPSGEGFPLNANEPLLVEVLVTVSGEHLYAKHFTKDAQLKITGFSMQFSTLNIDGNNNYVPSAE